MIPAEHPAACTCGWPETECLRRVLGNGPPFPPEPCEPKLGAAPVKETASSAARGSDTPTGSGPEVSAATTEPRTLEELVEAGEVEAALLLKGAYTKHEMELVRDAWAAGIKMGKEIERSRRAHGLT